MKKYELTDNIKTVFYNNDLHQIRALRDFGIVKTGDLGGWVKNETNLSHEGNCWVFDDAQVFDNAKVSHDAMISGNAKVYDDARVFDNAKVFDNAVVYKNACIFGNAQIFGNQIENLDVCCCDQKSNESVAGLTKE